MHKDAYSSHKRYKLTNPCFNGHSRYTSTGINKYTLFLYFSIFFSFFLIGKQRTIINEKKKERSTSCSRWWTTRNRWNKQQNKGEGNQKDNLMENINSERDEESVKPQQRNHSKRLRWHKTFNSSNVFSMFSKEQRFRSNQTIHIKFQIFKLCFPSH